MAATRIDCDIHPAVGGTRTTLLPYLDDHWKEQVVSRAIDGLDLNSYPPNMPLSGRADWRPANGDKPGSDLAMVQRGAFDQLGASHAICNVLYGAQAVFDPYMAADFCKAINDWIAAEWLSKDSRLRASIVVPMQAPDLAIEEIERRAADNRFVSVLVLAQGEQPARQAAFLAGVAGRGETQTADRDPCRQPVPRRAEFGRLAVLSLRILHGGGAGVPGPGAEPDLRRRVRQIPRPQGGADGIRHQLAAGLHVARQQDLARRPRRGALGRARAGLDHARPFPLHHAAVRLPPDAAGVADIIDMIGSDKMFLFSSDYPHWQFDGDDAMPPHLPASLVQRMCADNPLETFPRLSLAADNYRRRIA